VVSEALAARVPFAACSLALMTATVAIAAFASARTVRDFLKGHAA
jgi:hypothetical protein